MLAALQATAQPRFNARRGTCYLNMPGTNAAPTQALTDAEKTALNDAIQDEYKARATYNKILDTFGEVLPFAHIVNAEERHVEALAFLHTRYGVAIPEDTWADKVPAYATLKEAAEAAVQAEKDNGALYDKLAENVTNPEVTNVFDALQFATMEHHLPAFQRLVDFENGVAPQVDDFGRGSCYYGAPMCGAAGGCGMGMGAGRGRGAGLNGGFGGGRGRGAGWNAGNGAGRGQGLGARVNARPGRGLGAAAGNPRGAGMGPGRGMGRAAGLNPNCPWNTAR
jgi:hypothetical protein